MICVYIYNEPITNIPRYIGMGDEFRAVAHLSIAGNVKLNTMIKDAQDNDIKIIPIMVPLQTRKQAEDLEMFMISVYGREDQGTGTLYNLTGGGPGAKSPAEFIKRRIKEKAYIRNTETYRKNMSERLKGRVFTQDHKDKISAAHKEHAKQIVTCPHCQKIGSIVGMKTWHFDNCRNKT